MRLNLLTAGTMVVLCALLFPLPASAQVLYGSVVARWKILREQ